jgi:death-on-curing protein
MFMGQIDFLTLDDILAIHAEQLQLYGGSAGFIDRAIVESATEQPRMTMFGQYLHPQIKDMAAAYLYHFAASQGFADGNKRTALVAAVEFLGRNGYSLDCTNDEIYDITMRVANHLMNKQDIADWILEKLIAIP